MTNSLALQVATAINDPGDAIAQQDILVGLLSAAGQVGEMVNQPEVEDIEDFIDPFTGRRVTATRRNNRRNPDLLAAAISGFFNTTAERLGERSNRIAEEGLSQPSVLIVERGTRVSVFFNTFFEIQR